jgi:hypothetical protein
LANGSYCFRADWPGDTTYPGALSATDTSNECFRVLQLGTTTVTSPQAPSGTNVTTVSLGTSVYDHAVVTNTSGSTGPTGTVNFYICTPSQVTGTGTSAHCAGTGSTGDGTLKQSVTPLTAGPNTNQSQATTTIAVVADTLGVWCFRADYVPDTTVFTGSTDNTNDECFSVTTTSSASSAQNWLPNDHVTISTPTGSLAGTLSITLRSGNCLTGTVVYTEPVPNSGAFTATAAGATYDTTNGSVTATTFKVDTNNAAAYYWKIVFTPTSSFGGGAITKCETSTVTVNDNP